MPLSSESYPLSPALHSLAVEGPLLLPPPLLEPSYPSLSVVTGVCIFIEMRIQLLRTLLIVKILSFVNFFKNFDAALDSFGDVWFESPSFVAQLLPQILHVCRPARAREVVGRERAGGGREEESLRGREGESNTFYRKHSLQRTHSIENKC